MERKLECPECGKVSLTYKEHFSHWTSHYKTKIAEGKIAPLEHDEAVKFYKEYPQEIEDGFRVVGIEVGVFRGRIDIVGFDRNGNLTIVDVTQGKDMKRKIQQLRKYRNNLKWIAREIFRINLPDKIRLLVIELGKGTREI